MTCPGVSVYPPGRIGCAWRLVVWLVTGLASLHARAAESDASRQLNLPAQWITLRVGAIEVPFGKHPDFDVVADERRGILHFVWRNNTTLSYCHSTSGGEIWSAPEPLPAAGRAPRLAVDNRGTLHVIHETASDQTPRLVWHKGEVRIFYAESAPVRQPFRFYQRVITEPASAR